MPLATCLVFVAVKRKTATGIETQSTLLKFRSDCLRLRYFQFLVSHNINALNCNSNQKPSLLIPQFRLPTIHISIFSLPVILSSCVVSNGYLSASSVSSAERDNYGYDFCVAYTNCVATPWHDRIYLYICTRELSACHLV